MTADYKSTVFLPATDFPMKAGLAEKEPGILARWEKLDIYARLRERSKGREQFVLHDGPPYANGHLHNGHALNKILKDVITRSQQMLGKDANYVPGWDCHGLPIEWKIEERYRAQGRRKDEIDVIEFRRECRQFAEEWIDIQREEFKRLGITGDWKRPYTTMAFAAEAQIVRELGKFLMAGDLYKGAKPVLWSVVEKTALADAEVEYQDHTSTTIWIRFPVIRTPVTALEGASVVIWTTTPWTMPGNRAVAYGPGMDYVVFRVTATAEGSLARAGERIAVCADLLDDVLKQAKISEIEEIAHVKGADLAGTVCRHPWAGKGYDFEVPLLSGLFVTTDQGTGFVHMAPGHGEDDYFLCLSNGIAPPDTVDGDGLYMDHVPGFAGKHVFKVAPDIVAAMIDAGALLAQGSLTHSYPHSWRSKAPLIFRNTPQWFISMEKNGLRDKALAAIDDTRWVPPQGRNRIRAMIESRPDWCVSRQRSWGVPIAIFVDKRDGLPLRDAAVTERIAQAFEAEGADAWFTGDPRRFLGAEHDPENFEPVRDIVEVWFDSGSTHAFVLEARDDLKWPADLYLEGSDQHRGWFHTSLLESCGTRGRAPYDAVLTHGFLLDEKGDKLSKSKGNAESPQKVVSSVGADIMRLWVVSSDYTGDIRFGPEILKQTTDTYRRLRNTLRFLLGALAGFDKAERLDDLSAMPELERWVLHRLSEIDVKVRGCCDAFSFHEMFQELHGFCAVDLSAFYLDIRKDALYCDDAGSLRRRACRTVIDRVFDCLVKWLAPFVCFTAEEAWLTRFPSEDDSVHFQSFPTVPGDWRDDALAERWTKVRRLRRVITGALEVARANKTIGASLQAAPVVHAPAELLNACAGLDMAEISITSDITLTDSADQPIPEGAYTLDEVAGVGVVVALAEGEKCQRCWEILPDVGTHAHEGLCGRCDEVVSSLTAG
ncbi:isoleucine--tRNA ligase [Rhodospirillum rubrum]|uniref:isoleucine--tRNA ligase n=1 Tax=Rhodospirillum rubrum TaxID=1085 RepID=UPI0019064A0A|nr:isoleucine--tRNA ligase [Rhodospirillum rubrum]MBK1664478.1 isoleucine--tRNA ligase [Rhodospirillum rubrum]MBK1676265.1 isoleucine--tRNA ligase [Rhodospirillum rubrum]